MDCETWEVPEPWKARLPDVGQLRAEGMKTGRWNSVKGGGLGRGAPGVADATSPHSTLTTREVGLRPPATQTGRADAGPRATAVPGPAGPRPGVGDVIGRWWVGRKDGWSQPWAGHSGGRSWATRAGRAGLAGWLGRVAGRRLLGLGQGQRFPSSRRIGLTRAAGRRHGRGLEVWRWCRTAQPPPRAWRPSSDLPQGPGLTAEGVTREVSCVCVCARVCTCECVRLHTQETDVSRLGPAHPWREMPTP